MSIFFRTPHERGLKRLSILLAIFLIYSVLKTLNSLLPNFLTCQGFTVPEKHFAFHHSHSVRHEGAQHLAPQLSDLPRIEDTKHISFYLSDSLRNEDAQHLASQFSDSPRIEDTEHFSFYFSNSLKNEDTQNLAPQFCDTPRIKIYTEHFACTFLTR